MRTITVEPYSPAWPEAFEKIKAEIYPAVRDDILSFEHVGSTSVAGLWAKPIIDIDIVTEGETLPVLIEKLASLGYVHCGDLGIPGREAFDYDEAEKAHLMAHHLYVCDKNNAELKQHIAFRDFLRSSPEYRAKYSQTKIEMAKRYPHDIDSYIKGKEPVVFEVLRLCGIEPWSAKKWFYTKHWGKRKKGEA